MVIFVIWTKAQTHWIIYLLFLWIQWVSLTFGLRSFINSETFSSTISAGTCFGWIGLSPWMNLFLWVGGRSSRYGNYRMANLLLFSSLWTFPLLLHVLGLSVCCFVDLRCSRAWSEMCHVLRTSAFVRLGFHVCALHPEFRICLILLQRMCFRNSHFFSRSQSLLWKSGIFFLSPVFTELIEREGQLRLPSFRKCIPLF